MSEYSELIDELHGVIVAFGDMSTIGNLARRAADALEAAEAANDPAKDERLVRFMAMATPLGYQSALTVVVEMTKIPVEKNGEGSW